MSVKIIKENSKGKELPISQRVCINDAGKRCVNNGDVCKCIAYSGNIKYPDISNWGN